MLIIKRERERERERETKRERERERNEKREREREKTHVSKIAKSVENYTTPGQTEGSKRGTWKQILIWDGGGGGRPKERND
ncbi:hypothetical protein RUM43_012628 [Polyplax serrata]|uniref:Uncharacterized protein n=1 Tax=Polyplax serrata TaxID=468196 RepID=A0AAN8PIA6_POLSC